MRVYVRLVAFLNGVLAVLVGAGMVLSAYPPPGFVPYRDLADLVTVPGTAPYWALGGTVLVVLNAVALSRRLFGAYRAKDIQLVEGRADVRVKTAAIEDLLARIAKGNALVTDAKVRVFSLMLGRYRILCALSLVDSPELHGAIDQVRARLRGRFLDIFPKAASVDVDVTVTAVVRDAPRGALLEDAFQGPQYPVGDEFPLPTERRPSRRK